MDIYWIISMGQILCKALGNQRLPPRMSQYINEINNQTCPRRGEEYLIQTRVEAEDVSEDFLEEMISEFKSKHRKRFTTYMSICPRTLPINEYHIQKHRKHYHIHMV
jgi:hypothetical protein